MDVARLACRNEHRQDAERLPARTAGSRGQGLGTHGQRYRAQTRYQHHLPRPDQYRHDSRRSRQHRVAIYPQGRTARPRRALLLASQRRRQPCAGPPKPRPRRPRQPVGRHRHGAADM